MQMLKATKRIRYGGKAVQAGAVFMAKDADVRILLAIKHATVYVAPPPLPPIVRKQVKSPGEEIAERSAELASKSLTADDEDKPKRTYKTRDMKAE